jgi:hypothetical protein
MLREYLFEVFYSPDIFGVRIVRDVAMSQRKIATACMEVGKAGQVAQKAVEKVRPGLTMRRPQPLCQIDGSTLVEGVFAPKGWRSLPSLEKPGYVIIKDGKAVTVREGKPPGKK